MHSGTRNFAVTGLLKVKTIATHFEDTCFPHVQYDHGKHFESQRKSIKRGNNRSSVTWGDLHTTQDKRP